MPSGLNHGGASAGEAQRVRRLSASLYITLGAAHARSFWRVRLG
jgi:hypothetical protein